MTNWLETLIGETRVKLLRLLRRPPQTVTTMADALGLTDNAVRIHVAALGRDGIVEPVGTLRDTGGKPARVYALTKEGEELFPKAYATVLAGLVEELVRRDGPAHAEELLGAVGERLAAGVVAPAAAEGRVQAAASALRSIGGDVEVIRSEGGWRLQGYGCPLSAVTPGHPEVCALARTLVERVTGLSVAECCDRSARPRCAFQINELRS